METLDGLCRRIYELDPKWFRPGMACRSAGVQWRFVSYLVGWVVAEMDPPRPVRPTFAERDAAIETGPDHTDPATLGAILLGLPQVRVVQDCHNDMWISGHLAHVESGAVWTPMAELILRAEVARLEAR